VGEGFTLIELLMVMGIIAMIMAIGIPAFVQAQRKAPMRQAVSDVMEACSHARTQAILRNVPMDLHFHPKDYTFDVAVARGATANASETGPLASHDDGAKGFSGKLPEDVGVELLDVNLQPLKDADEAVVRFHPNSTCDEFTIVLRSIGGEYTKLSLEITTGRVNMEIIK
jgi:prepilin-type N-terminal cleavage/methylation domain-containing protein